MGKNSTRELLKEVVLTLSKGAQSIAELAESTKFDRTAITRYLELFKEVGLVSEIKGGRKRIFQLISSYSPNGDTYFGLPLTLEQEKIINSIYAKIRNLWFEKTKRYPVQIQVQKSLFRIDKECDLKLPFGWYLFGALCVKPYDANAEYEFTGLSKQVEDCVSVVIEEYTKDQFAYQLKIRQYEEEENAFYLLKEKILRILHYNGFSKSHLGALSSKIRQLFSQAPKPKDNVYYQILSEYQDLIVNLMSVFDEDKLKSIHPEITGSFEDIWKLIALYNYKDDLKDFYSKEVLDRHFAIDIIQQEREITERCSYLQSLLPIQEEPQDEVYNEIKRNISEIKKSTDDEQSEKTKTLERLKAEKGEKAEQDLVLEKLGLN